MLRLPEFDAQNVLVERLIDVRVTNIDTSDMYGSINFHLKSLG